MLPLSQACVFGRQSRNRFVARGDRALQCVDVIGLRLAQVRGKLGDERIDGQPHPQRQLRRVQP